MGFDYQKLEKWHPSRASSRDTSKEVRVALNVVNKEVILRLYIGKSLLEKIGFVDIDDTQNKVDIFFNKEEKKIIYVTKPSEGAGSYLLTELKKKNGTKADYFRIVFKSWLSPDDVKQHEKKSHLVKHTIQNHFLVVDFS